MHRRLHPVEWVTLAACVAVIAFVWWLHTRCNDRSCPAGYKPILVNFTCGCLKLPED